MRGVTAVRQRRDGRTSVGHRGISHREDAPLDDTNVAERPPPVKGEALPMMGTPYSHWSTLCSPDGCISRGFVE